MMAPKPLRVFLPLLLLSLVTACSGVSVGTGEDPKPEDSKPSSPATNTPSENGGDGNGQPTTPAPAQTTAPAPPKVTSFTIKIDGEDGTPVAATASTVSGSSGLSRQVELEYTAPGIRNGRVSLSLAKVASGCMDNFFTLSASDISGTLYFPPLSSSCGLVVTSVANRATGSFVGQIGKSSDGSGPKLSIALTFDVPITK